MQERSWKAIAQQLESEIASGALAPGSRMLSGDALAKKLGVNRNTVHRAIEELQRIGLVVRKQGSGTVITERSASRASRIALLVDGYSAMHNFPSADLLRGIQERIGSEATLIIADSRHSPDQEAKQFAKLAVEADGIIFYSCRPRLVEPVRKLQRSQFPLVALDRLPVGIEVDGVVTENHGAIYKVVKTLIEQGHRAIGFLATDKPDFSSVIERVDGYRSAMTEAGLDPEEHLRWIPEGSDSEFAITSQVVRDTMIALRYGPYPISALVCLEDNLGHAATLAASRLGISVPNELEIATFNDWHATSLHQPWNVRRIVQQKYNLGYAAADLLLKRLASPTRPFEVVRVDAEIVPLDADYNENPSSTVNELTPTNAGLKS